MATLDEENQQVLLERGIALRVVDSWAARAAGPRVVVAHPRKLLDTPPDQLPVSVCIEIHTGCASLESTAAEIMRHRVPASGVDAVPGELFGARCVTFEWTDGILDIQSDFVAVAPDRVLEITFAAEPDRGRTRVIQPTESLRDTLGRFVDLAFLVERASGLEAALVGETVPTDTDGKVDSRPARPKSAVDP